MALPAATHTFALKNCHDLLDKLLWEIERLEGEIKRIESEPEPPEGEAEWVERLIRDVDELSYGAFNCAVTAWALSDWVFQDLKIEQRPPTPELEDFQKDCREQCPALRFCHLIANGSKHGPLERKGLEREKKIEPTIEHDGNRWRITITAAGEQHDAVTVFNQAWKFWDEKIRGENIAEVKAECSSGR